MKTILIVLTVVSFVIVAYGFPKEENESKEKYTDRYDNINIDEILENKRLLNNYIDCVLDKNRCTAEGDELKRHIADALQTKCSKCTDKQRKGVEKVIRHLVNHENAAWNELCKKYDPESKYRKEYEEEAKKYGIHKL